MYGRSIFSMLLLGACAGQATPDQSRIIQSGDSLDVQWATSGDNRDAAGSTPRGTVECNHVISHPCPFLLYTTRLAIEGTNTVWADGTGGSDANGVPAENHLPWTDSFVLDADGNLLVSQRGDDGGLREATTLTPVPGGYEGDVSWLLFNVAGLTTFHVELTWQN